MTEEHNVVAVYNDMQLKVLRLDENWRRAISSRRNAEYQRLKEELIIIWDELYPLVVKNKFKKIIEYNDRINKKLSNNNASKGIIKESLDTKYRFLKYVQDKVGLGTKTRKDMDEEDDMDY